MAEKDRMRKIKLQVFLTEEEDEILKRKCDEYNLSKSGFVRGAILYGGAVQSAPRIDEKIITDLIFEVNKIGNNINQIAYTNNVKNESTVREMVEAKEQLYSALGLIVDVLNGLVVEE